MARHKAFDREAALKAAMTVFWGKGYDATTTDDLLSAMGIARQSLYDTFGDKRALYLEALQAYSAGNVSAITEVFRKSASPVAAIRDVLFAVSAKGQEDRLRGCMGVQSISEFGALDSEVAAIGKMSSVMLRSTLERILAEAKAAREVPPSLDVRRAAKFLHAALLGMQVRARAGDSPR